MVKLSEEMIIARTRVSDMAHVKKLNCWGADLTDVSVLRKLQNVEVLSLSVNGITTLADVQDCKNLQVSSSEILFYNIHDPEKCIFRFINQLQSNSKK
jgi:hypothetical protein